MGFWSCGICGANFCDCMWPHTRVRIGLPINWPKPMGGSEPPRYITRHRDGVHSEAFIRRLTTMGIRNRAISARSAWQRKAHRTYPARLSWPCRHLWWTAFSSSAQFKSEQGLTDSAWRPEGETRTRRWSTSNYHANLLTQCDHSFFK